MDFVRRDDEVTFMRNARGLRHAWSLLGKASPTTRRRTSKHRSLDDTISIIRGAQVMRGTAAAGVPIRTSLVTACALAVCIGAADRVHAQGHGFTLPPGLAKKIPRTGPPARNATERRTLEQKGRRLFFEETFGGNGRTCGTCHPATNNFTVDPKYIRRLPKRDPMFVHERVRALRELENAVELRKNALFCENVDTFDNDCVLRGVPHTLGLDASIKQSKRGIAHALGWSGDGSANDGSLREFAVGAVVQHFPKTLNRVVDVDFKMPTAEQLDALLAFQKSLGRSADVDLASLRFADDEANRGIRVFLNGGRPGGCHACHRNAGANDNIGNNFNGNFATGTIKLRPDLPHDGGFGTDPGNGHGLGD